MKKLGGNKNFKENTFTLQMLKGWKELISLEKAWEFGT